MIINYNSLSRGRDAWLKKDVGDFVGSPPTGISKVTRSAWLLSFFLALFLLAGQNLIAQVNLYSYATSTGNSLESITSPTVLTTTVGVTFDDDYNTISPAGFTFRYNNIDYTQFGASTNGWIKMGNTSATSIFSSLTSVGSVNGVVAFGRDGNMNAAANGGNMTHGPAAGGKYVFQFVKLAGASGGNASATIYADMQVVLWGSTSATPGRIEIIYGTSAGTPGTNGTIGIVDSSNTYVNGVNGSTTTTTTTSAWPVSGTKYTFTPPPPCAAPANQATALTFGSATFSSIPVSFTAAASAPTGYLVVRYPSGAVTTNPVNVTTYTVGTALGLGTVVSVGTALSFTNSGLPSGTTYDYYVYDYNATGCSSGPVYNTIAPLTGSAATSSGTISGIKTIGTGGDYNNLTTAFAAINTNGLSGNVELQLIAGYPAAAETYPIVSSNAIAVGNNTVKIYPTVAGLSITSANTTGTLSLNNAKNITIDGRVNQTGAANLVIANTNAGTSYAVLFSNDATNNTIQYATVQSTNTSTSSGTIVFGTAAGMVTGNDNNTIANCEIKDGATFPINAIYSAGTSNAIDNSGNTISNNLISNYFGATGTNSNGINIASASSAWTITGNRFFQTATRTASSGQFTRAIQISTANGGGYTINNNIIGYANAAGTGTTTYAGAVANRFAGMDITVANTPVSNIQGNTVAGISLTTSSGATTTPGIFTGIAVSGSSNIGTTAANTIGAASGTGAISITTSSSGGAVWGIYSTASATTAVQNNVVSSVNITGTTASTGVAFVGIQVAGSGVFTVTGNTVGGNTANAIAAGTSGVTTATTTIVGIGSSVSGTTSDLSSNTVKNLRNYSTGTSSYLYGVYNTASATTLTMNSNVVTNNASNAGTFYGVYSSGSGTSSTLNSNLVNTNTTAGIGTHYLVYGGGATTVTMNNNILNANSITGASGNLYCMGSAGSGTYNVSGNQIYNNAYTANSGSTATLLYGFVNTASPTVENFTNNQIYDLSISGASTATTNAIVGILTNTATGTKTWSGNTIYNFNLNNSSTGGGLVSGMYSYLSSPNIFKNKIYNLTSNGAGSAVYGIYINTGTNVQIYNNLIGGLYAPTSSLTAPNPSIMGIGFAATASINANVYYNTVNITGSGGTNFGSAAIFANTTATVNLRNNIFTNTATASGTGKSVAYQRSSATLGTYAATSNNNLFYAGTPGASNVIYFDGTNADQTLADFKTRMATRDQVSVTQNPSFTSTTGSATDFLHIAPATPTFIESGAVAIAGFADDFDGDARNATTPDIGADEFTGTPIGCVAATAGTIASPSAAASICVSAPVTITASGYSSGNGTTYQWESSTDAGFTSPVAIGTPTAVYSNFSGTVNANISYRLKVVCTNGPVTSYSNVVSFTVSNPTITSTTPAARCGVGTVTLAATAGSGETVHWYSASTGGSSLGTGSSFVTPTINASTTFYASPEIGTSSTATIGAGISAANTAPYSPADGGYGGQKGQYLFTAAELLANGLIAGNINSLSFEATVAGSALQGFTVQMGNTALTEFSTPVTIVGGLTTVLNSATLTPVVGVNTLTLSTPFNWDGASNIIVSTSWSNNNSSNTGSTIMYDATTNYSSQSYRKDAESAANMLAFSGATGSGTNRFDRSQNRPKFTFTASGCSGTRTAVVATVSTPPALTLSAASASICAGDATLTPVTVTSTIADYDTYTWSPATGVAGNPTSGYIFNPASTTIYTLTASQSAGSLCQNTVAFTVNVNALPTITSLTATPASVCLGQVSTLTAVVPTTTANGYVLTGSTGTYTPITGTTVSVLDEDEDADDVGVGNLPIGFTFNYNGVAQTVFGVSSNGLLVVGNALPSITGYSSNALASNANVIAPLWDDNNIADGTIIYATTGTVGSRKLTVQWTNMNVGSSGSNFSPTISMQAILYETGGIEFRYGSTSSALSSITASIGISTASGNYKSVTPGSPASASTASSTAEYSVTASTNIPSGTVYSFAPPLTSTVTWSPLDNLYTTAAATTAYTGGPATTVYAKLTEPAVYKATAKTTANCETSQEVSVSIGNPPVADIAGPDSICIEGSNTITLTNATPTGVWSSSNTAIATIDGTGVLTPLTAGVVTISYAVTSTGCTTTKTKEVAVNEPVAIVSSTPTQTIAAGTDTTFTVVATGTGTPALTYQWEITADGDNYTSLTDNATYSGTNTAVLTINDAGIELNETLYRVVVTGACGSVPTELAVLLVGDTGIDTQPTNQIVCESPTAAVNFTVVASEDVTDYQWYEDRGGDNWLPITDGGIYAGATTTTLSLSGLAFANNGWKYKVQVTGLGFAESNPVTLTVIPAVVVTRPANQTVCYTGATTSFTTTITAGTATTFAWQYSSDNGLNWNPVANATPVGVTYATANTATLGVTTTAATPSTGIYLYRVMVGSASCGNVFSESAQLVVNRPTIVTQPAAASVAAGNNAVFTVNATTIGTPTYQWQFATTLNGAYANVVDATPGYVTYSGATSAALTVQTTGGIAAGSAYFYRVIISSPVGCSVTSTGAQMTVSNYCRATYSSGANTVDQIANVTLGTLNNDSGASTAPFYTYFGNVNVPNVQQLTTANVSVKFGDDTANYAAVWIDFDHSNTFEASEGVVSTATTAAFGTTVLSIPVPLSALTGQTRMRVRGGDDSALTTSQACGASNSIYGESEDYIVNIIAALPCSGTPVAGTITSSATTICISGSATLTASGYTVGSTGVSMQWHNSAGPIATATAATFTTPTLTANETYFLRVTCANGSAFSDSNSIVITVNNPTIVSTTPATRCGVGTAVLNATASAGSTVNWFSQANGGSILYSGEAFTTPSVATTTTFYAAASVGALSTYDVSIGNATTLTGDTEQPTAFCNRWSKYRGQYLFTAAELNAAGIQAGNINSIALNIATLGSAATNANFKVSIAPTTATELTSTLVNTGLVQLFGPVTYTHAVGLNTIVFNTPFAWDGSSNIIVNMEHDGADSDNNAQTYYTTTTANMAAFNYGSTSSGVSKSRPNIKFTGANGCLNSRVPVVVTVTAPPALALSSSSATICSGASTTTPVTVSQGSANYTSYSWAPTTGVSGTAATGFTFNPTATTNYTLTATNASGCVNTTTFTVTVNATPTAHPITPATAVLCEGGIQALVTGAPASAGGTAVFGTGTTAPTATTYPNPLSSFYGGAKHQILFTAAELTAQGLVEGSSVNALTFYLEAINATGVLTDYTIRMGATSNTALTGLVAGTSTVYGPTTFAPSATGLITFNLSTPYIWNGTSNLIVETVYNGNDSGRGSGSRTRTTTTPTNTVYYATKDGVTGGISGFDAVTTYSSATGASNSRPNMTFVYSNLVPVWTPTTGLFTDAAATVAYTGTGRGTVYAKPLTSTTYTATYTIGNCSSTTTATVNVNHLYNFYADGDGDGYGVGSPVQFCVASHTQADAPAGYAPLNGDCNDNPATGALVNPGMAEIFYNGIDDNCDGNIDEGRQITTTVLANRCNTKLTKIYDTVNCEFRIAGVTGYRFRVTNQSNTADVQTIDRPTAAFSFNQLTRFEYGTAYTVEVMIQRNNVWLNYYGTGCTVTTPDVATLAVCGGTVAAKGTFVYSEVLLYATAYRFEVTNVATNQITPISNGHHYFTFNEIPGFTGGALYSVKVSVKTTGDWSAYGNPCVITAPGGSGPEIPTDKIEVPTSNVFKVAAYPNPYAEAFGLNITTESNAVVNVKVYDMLGKLIEIRNASVADLKEQRIGERYSAGVYNIIVTQEENVKTLRVIKR